MKFKVKNKSVSFWAISQKKLPMLCTGSFCNLRMIGIRLEEEGDKVEYYSYAEKTCRQEIEYSEKNSFFIKLMCAENAEEKEEKKRYPLIFCHFKTPLLLYCKKYIIYSVF